MVEKKRRTCSALLVGAALGWACFAAASENERGLSTWAGVGYSTVEGSLPDDSYAGVGARVGFRAQVRDTLAIGAGWMDLGSDNGLTADIAPLPSTQDSSAFWIAYVPEWRFGAWDVGATVGAARLRRSFRIPGSAFRFETQDTELLLGASATYRFAASQWGVRFELERIGTEATGGGVSIAYSF